MHFKWITLKHSAQSFLQATTLTEAVWAACCSQRLGLVETTWWLQLVAVDCTGSDKQWTEFILYFKHELYSRYQVLVLFFHWIIVSLWAFLCVYDEVLLVLVVQLFLRVFWITKGQSQAHLFSCSSLESHLNHTLTNLKLWHEFEWLATLDWRIVKELIH